MAEELLHVEGLRKFFPVTVGILASLSRSHQVVHAVENVSFSIKKGETLSLIGETGSGKTTVARLVLRLIDPTMGSIYFNGKDLLALKKKELQKIRQDMQMIFQDPYASLNPRKTVEDIIGLPLVVHRSIRGSDKRRAVISLLERVGLVPGSQFIDRFPHEFSGGQRQRISVARAIALTPKLIVADEPVSALDVSIRSQILNLMQDLKSELGLTYLAVAHDLSVVRLISDNVAVMYLGRIVELAPSEVLFTSPQHPYTEALLAAVPVPDPDRRKPLVRLKGEIPSPIYPPPGCPLHTRCPYVREICCRAERELTQVGNSLVACHFPERERSGQ